MNVKIHPALVALFLALWAYLTGRRITAHLQQVDHQLATATDEEGRVSGAVCDWCQAPYPDDPDQTRAWWSAHGGLDDALYLTCSLAHLEAVLVHGFPEVPGQDEDEDDLL